MLLQGTLDHTGSPDTIPVYLWAASRGAGLAQPNTIFAARLAAVPQNFMLWLNLLTGGAIIVVVINLPMCRRILRRRCVIRIYFCHFLLLSELL